MDSQGQQLIASKASPPETTLPVDMGKDYEVLLAKADSAREEHRQEMRELHAGFHRVWGQMMKAGNQNSRFAHQLERYACLYTSHARNLVAYSPAKSYRGLSDAMPHDMDENV